MDDGNQKHQWKKTIFSVGLVSFCLGTATKMGFDPTLTTKVSEIVADGLITTAMFCAVSFLAADSVDTSGILHKIGRRMGGRVVADPPPPPPEPVYRAVDPNDYVDPSEAKG
jgi:hypothetical protein